MERLRRIVLISGMLCVSGFVLAKVLLIPSIAMRQNMVAISSPDRVAVTVPHANNSHHNNTRLILFWTTFYSRSRWPYRGDDPFSSCPHSNCRYTHDQSLSSQADLLLFHCRGLTSLKSHGWPPARRHDQKYVLMCGESPVHTDFSPFSGRINMTATYRWDSDIFIGKRFGVRSPPTARGARYALRNSFTNRTKNVVWLASNCHGGPRQAYVKQLSKHIDVDVYGRCGPYSCPKHGRNHTFKCFSQFARTYKFYLAFENSVCLDYITEKLSNALNVELIPVVLGGGNYSRNAPPHSVINVADYPSPRALAEYLLYLSEHEQDYLEYFQWKMDYQVDFVDRSCAYCEAANRPGFHREASTFDLSRWWKPPGVCYPRTIQRLLE